MKAMVLAAGLGTRLRPATDVVPKPLFPVLGVPAIEWVLRTLAAAGVTDAVVNVHHLPARLISAMGPAAGGVRLSYSDEPVVLGTGGGLSAVRDFFAGGDAFLLHNGDVFTDWDLAPLVAHHRASGAAATLALTDPPDMPRARLVEVDGTRVVGIRDRPASGSGPRYVYSGVAVLSPDLFRFLPRGEVSCLVEQGLIPMMRDGLRVEGVVQAGRFCDIGTAERFLALQWEVLPDAADLFARRGLPAPLAVPATPGLIAYGRIDIAPDAVVRGPVLACEGARIGAGAVVGPRVVLAPGAIVEAGARVADAVVLAGVRAAGEVSGIVYAAL